MSATKSKSETDIASRYGLIDRSVTQLNSLVLSNTIGNVGNISGILRDKGKSYVSTMSIMSHLNPYTQNKRLALIHSTGTGKTRKALLTALQYNRDITVVVVHHIQSKPFVSEFSNEGIIHKVYPAFNKRMDTLTCRSIMTADNKGDRDRLNYFFRDRVIIIDEVHHVRDRGNKRRSNVSLFDTIARVLSWYKDLVVILLTATPLVDSVSEISGLYSLLTGNSSHEYNYDLAINNLRGYISKLKKKNLDTKDIEVKCLMVADGEQWRLYQKHQHDTSSVHSKTFAVGRFITDDDAEASDYSYKTVPAIDHMLSNMTFDSQEEHSKMYMLALKSISIKHYMLVQNLMKYRGHPHFVFDMWRRRGGMDRVLDVLTMPIVGYTSITTEKEALDRSLGLKLLALHKVASKSSSGVASRLLDIYNSEDNKDGSLIDVLLATPKFAESMSVRTAKYNHSLNCFWNRPARQQVNGRINRRTSLPYEPEENRIIFNLSYVLYKPDGSDTVESGINRKSDIKYSEIKPVLGVMNTIKLENYYSVDKSTKEFTWPTYPHNSRVNTSVRMSTPAVNHREISMNVESFLKSLEESQDLYTLLEKSNNSDEGYVRVLSITIQTAEYVYIQSLANNITEKQKKMLKDLSAAFMKYEDKIIHMLYFANSDTVEYQRMNKLSKRVVRVLCDNVWVDSHDEAIVLYATNKYNGYITTYTSKIFEDWQRLGFYMTKYALSACYRLIEYRAHDRLVKSGYSHNVDGRKVSRGEKWVHYNKVTLLKLLAKLNGYTSQQCIVIYKKCRTVDIFTAVLSSMTPKGLVLELPI